MNSRLVEKWAAYNLAQEKQSVCEVDLDLSSSEEGGTHYFPGQSRGVVSWRPRAGRFAC